MPACSGSTTVNHCVKCGITASDNKPNIQTIHCVGNEQFLEDITSKMSTQEPVPGTSGM